jgi:transposase
VWLTSGLQPAGCRDEAWLKMGLPKLVVAMPTSPSLIGLSTWEWHMGLAIIGVDPHKLSATIEVVDEHEKFLGSGRFSTDRAGYGALRTYAKAWPERVWAVEGANGAGRPLAQRLLEAGEQVVDVPAKLAARVRVFDTGHNRKTDALDAHSIAIVAVRTEGLRVLKVDGELQALRLLTDRREALTRRRVQTVNRLQALLAELLPGQAKKDISALQAKAMLATVRPRDVAGKTCRRLATEELAELIAVEAKMKKATAELKVMVLARRSRLMDLPGVGPVVAARVLADVGDVARFADRNRFASWTGTAPLDASSGEQNRHRLSRAGNRRMNHMIHIAAVTQLRYNTDGRIYYRRKRAEGKKPLEALRCVSSAGSPTPSIASCSSTSNALTPASPMRAREGNAGRLKNPARPAHTRAPALRIGHFPDPHNRRYPRPRRHGTPEAAERSKRQVDNRWAPECSTQVDTSCPDVAEVTRHRIDHALRHEALHSKPTLAPLPERGSWISSRRGCRDAYEFAQPQD